MTRFLEGRTAVVTGGSRGLGKATALELGGLGALVAINYARNEAAARETADLIAQAGGEAFIVQSELGSHQSAERLASLIEDELRQRGSDGGIDILVNNAGGGEMADIAGTTPEIMERTIADNFTGPFYATKLLLPRMRDGGRIINISSKAATGAYSHFIVYSMCKAAINTFTVALAREVGPRQITVNSIMPGLISSDANAHLRDDPEMVRHWESNTALGRIGVGKDLSGVVKSLVSPDMGYVTGQIIEVSGGLFI